MLAADLLARSHARAEIHEDAGRFAEAATLGVEVQVFAETMKPAAAIAAIQRKVPMPKPEFMALADRYKAKGFTIAGVQNEDVLKGAHDAMTRAIAEGTSYEDFRRQVNDAFDAKGVTRRSDFHLRTVFQTNNAQAYGGGRWAEFHEPEVLADTAYYVYDAVDDDRTRPTHRQMDGYRAAPDDPIWKRWWPPNGFN